MICKDPLEVISFIRLEMVRRGIKISDLASKLEVSNQNISQTLKTETAPPFAITPSDTVPSVTEIAGNDEIPF